VAAFSDTNGGLYMALMAQLGKRVEDVAAYSIIYRIGPVLHDAHSRCRRPRALSGARVCLRVASARARHAIGQFRYCDPRLLRPGVALFIPFFALALGTTINLRGIVIAGASGILLGVFVVAVTGTVLLLSPTA